MEALFDPDAELFVKGDRSKIEKRFFKGAEIPVSGGPNVKYCLVTAGATWYPSLLKKDVERPGLYNWCRLFNGEVLPWADFQFGRRRLDEFDIVHCNLAGLDIPLVKQVREALPRSTSTKLVVNLDYGLEVMQYATNDPLEILGALLEADFILAVEPAHAGFIEFLLKTSGRPTKIQVIPHPQDSETIKKPFPEGMFLPYDQRGDILMTHFHRYDSHVFIPVMLMQNLPKTQSGVNFTRALVGYAAETSEKAKMLASIIHNLEMRKCLEMILPMQSWQTYMRFAMTVDLCLDYYSISSHGRVQEDMACIGVPCVSTNYSYSATKLYPEITHDPRDIKGMRASLEKLITDPEFYSRIAEFAYNEVDFYSFSRSRERLLTAMGLK